MYLAMAAALGVAACSKDSTAPAPAALVSDAQVQTDVAQSSGDAMASTVGDMLAGEGAAALPSPGFNLFGSPPAGDSVTSTRTRACFDANGAVVTNCSPTTSVRKIVQHVQIDGTRTGPNYFGAVHRVRDDTTTRNFNTAQPPVEVSRTHSSVGTSKDTVNFTDGTVTRIHAESAIDSVRGVTWNLPRANNPFPVAGTIVRNVTVHASYHSATRTETKDVTKRVEVDFPADAQGNVVLKIDNKTCNLNLVTRAVSNCH